MELCILKYTKYTKYTLLKNILHLEFVLKPISIHEIIYKINIFKKRGVN